MTTQTYNGYTNYETWCVALWLNNDEGTNNYLDELANGDDYDHDWQRMDNLKAFVNDMHDNMIVNANGLASGMFYDLLNAALESVDWLEIIETHKES